MAAASDVYALGVMLYATFIDGRFPSILIPSGPHRAPAALSPVTTFGAFDGGGDDRADPQAILGAKVLVLHGPWIRVMDRASDLIHTPALLAVVAAATAHDPADRYPERPRPGRGPVRRPPLRARPRTRPAA